jgi:hypothetical protein
MSTEHDTTYADLVARHRALLEGESDEALRALVARSYACGYAQRWVRTLSAESVAARIDAAVDLVLDRAAKP